LQEYRIPSAVIHDRLIRCQSPAFCHRPTFRHCRLSYPREIKKEVAPFHLEVQTTLTLLLTDLLNRCHRLMYCHYPTFRHYSLNHPREIKKGIPLSHCRSAESRPITHDRLLRCQYPVFCHSPTFRHYRLNHPREINQGALPFHCQYADDTTSRFYWISARSSTKHELGEFPLASGVAYF
jgi:hypothetical protein